VTAPHFTVGEIAYDILWRCDVEILSPLELDGAISVSTGLMLWDHYHQVRRLDGVCPPSNGPRGNVWSVSPRDLRKKPQLGDGRQVVRWSECPWSPAKVMA